MVGQETAVNASSLSVKETRAQSLCWEDPLEKKQPPPVFLPRESRGQRSLTGYGPQGLKVPDMTGSDSARTHGVRSRHPFVFLSLVLPSGQPQLPHLG